jgi:hypothetical protein
VISESGEPSGLLPFPWDRIAAEIGAPYEVTELSLATMPEAIREHRERRQVDLSPPPGFG